MERVEVINVPRFESVWRLVDQARVLDAGKCRYARLLSVWGARYTCVLKVKLCNQYMEAQRDRVASDESIANYITLQSHVTLSRQHWGLYSEHENSTLLPA